MNNVIHVSELRETIVSIAKDIVREMKHEQHTMVMTVDDVAKECRVHVQTVRMWAKGGMKCIQKKPLLFLRDDVVEFLKGMRS